MILITYAMKYTVTVSGGLLGGLRLDTHDSALTRYSEMISVTLFHY